MSLDRDRFEFGREVERSMLYRGEYGQVLAIHQTAGKTALFVVVMSAIVCLIYRLLGIELEGTAMMVAAGIVVIPAMCLNFK